MTLLRPGAESCPPFFHPVHSYIEAIIEARSERISALLEMCYKLVDQYESATAGGSTICTYGNSSEECESLVYGCLIKGLKSLKLFPKRATVSEVESSVVALADKLRSLKCFAYPGDRKDPYYGYQGNGTSHSSCGFTLAFADQIKTIGGEEPSGVLEEHLTHINEQRK